MENQTLVEGIALVICGGVMEGAYSLPLKFTPKWNWENTWGAASLAALVLIPWPLAFWTVPALLEVYRHVSSAAIAWALVFGAAWGLGGVLLGLTIDLIGMSIGFSIILGIIAIDGSLIPLLWSESGKMLTPGGVWFVAAMAILTAGIVVCAVAGKRKEKSPEGQTRRGMPRQKVFGVGLALAVMSGLLCGCLNFALIFGTEVTQRAMDSGAGRLSATNGLWCLVFSANYMVNVIYCVYLTWRNHSARKFFARGTGSYWLQASGMGVTWALGIVMYGIGATILGRYGAFIGFPAMLATSILTANALGWLTGEWRGVRRPVIAIMLAGLGLLMLAILLLANANRLMVLQRPVYRAEARQV